MIENSDNTNLPQNKLIIQYSEVEKIQIKQISIDIYLEKLMVAINIVDIQNIVSCIRIILSDLDDPKIEELVQSGVVPYLIDLARKQISPQLTTEITWILTNVASGNQAQTQEIVHNGGIQLFVELLESKEQDILDHAIWGLGNIAGDSTVYRNMIISSGAINKIIKAFKLAIKTSIDLKNLVWCLSNLCRGNPEAKYEKVSMCIEVFCYAILNKNNVEVLTDSLWALSYLNARPSGDEEASTLILQSNILDRLISLLDHNQVSIQLPALRIIGNIVTGNEISTDKVLQAGFLKKVPQLLKHPKKVVRKETYWVLSNITAGSQSQNIQVINNELILNQMLNSIEIEELDVVREVAYVLSNSLCNISMEYLQLLMQKGLLRSFKKILQRFVDSRIIIIVIEGIIQILKKGNMLLENYYLIELKQLELDKLIYDNSQQFEQVEVLILYNKFAELL